MTKRKGSYSHYEVMFENFLRESGLLYIAINEAKRPLYRGERVKNFDFIVRSRKGKIILIDIKGKQFPYESKIGKNYWENWIGNDDGKFLKMWSEIFGATAITVYPYLLKYTKDEQKFSDVVRFKGNTYGIVAIEIEDYLTNSKPRSKSGDGTFNAISISREKFSTLVKPVSFFLG